MAVTPKPPVDEEAHFRIDELVREMEPIKEGMKPEIVAAIVHGAVAALRETLKSDIEGNSKATQECFEKMMEKFDAMIEVMMKPTIREVMLNLPSGPVSMSIKESK